MNTTIHGLPALALIIVTTALVTILSIYLTPLKHLNIISPTMNEIDPAVFYQKFTANPEQYLFIDVRSPSEYAAVHPKGSINIPIADLTDMHSQLPKNGKQIVLTCTTGRLAEVAYGYLQNWGFLNLLHITGGLQQWSLEGLPVEGTSVPKGSLSLAAYTICRG